MRRRGWLAVALLVAGVAASWLTLVTRDGGDRVAALALIAAGIAVGAVAAVVVTRRRTAAGPGQAPAERAPRTVAERMNDVAFLVVVTAVWVLLLFAVPGPWPALLTGVPLGVCGQRVARA